MNDIGGALPPDNLQMLHARRAELLASGERILDLSMINPDLAPPRLLIDKLMEAAGKPGNHRYAVSRGVRRLREAFAQKYEVGFGVQVDPEREICVTLGSKDALFSYLRLLEHNPRIVSRDGKRRALGITPLYPVMRAALTMLGWAVVDVAWDGDEDALLAQIDQASEESDARLLLMNFPQNPTGTTVSDDFLRELGEIAERRNLLVYNDFVYGELTFVDQGSALRTPCSVLRDRRLRTRAVESYSLSKAYSVPGWRVGALLGNPDLIRGTVRVKSLADYGLFLPLQSAAAAALCSPGLVAETAQIYGRRAAVLSRALRDVGFRCVEPGAGACVWSELPQCVTGNAESFCSDLLEQAHVAALPGTAFGERYQRMVRWALVAGEEALREVAARVAALTTAVHQSSAHIALGLLVVLSLFPLQGALAEAEGGCARAGQLVKQGVQLGDGSPEEERLYRTAIDACAQMAEAHHNLGIVYARRGMADDAIASFQRAIALRPDPLFRIALASFSLERGDVARARQEYEAALATDEKNIKALQGLSVVYERVGESDRALDVLERATKIEPANALTHFNLGALYDRRNDLPHAISEYQKVLEIDNDHQEAALYLGLALRRAGRMDEASRALARAAELNPESATVHQALGVVYERLGDSERAENSFRKAIALDAQDVASMINLGVVLINKKQESLAREVLERAVRLDPKNARAFNALGWAELQLGAYKEAERSLKQSLELDATSGSAHNNLGVLYQRTGRMEDAQREFKAAVRLDPALESARRNAERFGAD